MLLEQKNKERLMHARVTQEDFIAGEREHRRRKLNENTSMSTLKPRMPLQDTATGDARAAKRQKLEQPSGLGASSPVGSCSLNAPAEVSRHRHLVVNLLTRSRVFHFTSTYFTRCHAMQKVIMPCESSAILPF
jgi:hypothetical protein